jgi:hypothetical protein
MPAPRPLIPVDTGKPVAFVNVALEGVPKFGVTKVGDVANTAKPDPVSSVNAPANWDDVKDPKDVALPTEVTAPVRLALVVTLPAVKLAAVPVMFVPTRTEGVPKLGVTSVGEVDNTVLPAPVEVVVPVPPLETAKVPARVTAPEVAVEGVKPVVPALNELTPAAVALIWLMTYAVVASCVVFVPTVAVGAVGVPVRSGLMERTVEPVPVEVVVPVPPRATDKVPVVPATIGRSVAFVSVALEGVPRAGVTSVGEVAKTKLPVPVSSVTAL